MSKPYGMAVEITPKNRKMLALANSGVVPRKSTIGSIFVFPYNYDEHCEILQRGLFHRLYKFEQRETCRYFVEISKA